jgi:hypothetical protein
LGGRYVVWLIEAAISEEPVATIHRVEEYSEDVGTKFFRNIGTHLPDNDVISQKTEISII